MHFKDLFSRPQMIALPLACCFALSGCGKEEPKQEAQPKPPEQAAAQTAPMPAPAPMAAAPAPAGDAAAPGPVKGTEPLPANHPPMGTAKPAADAAPSGNVPKHELDVINKQLASNHPKSEGKAKPSVAIPDSVKGQWSAVNLSVTVDGAEKQVRVPIGDKVSVGKEGLTLHVQNFLPAYTSDFKTITSASNEMKNPAIQVQLSRKKEIVAEGWVFQNLPDFNSFVTNAAQVKLLSAEPAKK